MIIYQMSKKLCISLVLTALTFFYAHADEPIISERYPLNVNLNQSATLLLIGQNLSSPLTVTIGTEVISITDNTNPNRVTCAISSRSTPGEMELTVQNADGISELDTLPFSDCSLLAQVDDVIRAKDYTITVINTCYPKYEYQLDTNELIKLNTSQIVLKNLAEDSHQLIITGSDPAANKMSETFIFSVDSIEPEIQFVNKPMKISTHTSETISITTLTDATHYKYQLDTNAFVENAISDAIILTSLSLGTHTLHVYGCDSYDYCQSSSENSPITWTVIDISFADNSALTTTTVFAGTQSGYYSTNCTTNDVILEWNVYDYEDNKVGDTVVGETFSFTPSKNGAYAGVYTLSMSAIYDNQTIETLNAYIKVPFDIETNYYNIFQDNIFSVKGVESGASLIFKMKMNNYTSIETADDLSKMGQLGDYIDAESMKIIFKPSKSLAALSSFDIWISIENDADLNEDNGLFEQTTGPYFVIPLKKYSVILEDENGLITSTNTDFVIKEMVTQNNQDLIIPASGGTYFFKVTDNSKPPQYLSKTHITTDYTSTVILQPVGQYHLEGIVKDSDNALENITVTAFQPLDETIQSQYYTMPQQYEAKTESNGQFIIYLPESSDIGGWTVIAGKEGYESVIQIDQQVNSLISFDGIHALQLQTQITKVWIENDKILIQASPAFSERKEIDIRKITKTGNIFYPENHLENDIISVAKPDSDEYTLIIYADTVDNHHPGSGSFVCHAYRKDSSDKVLARNDKTMDTFGGTVSLDYNNYETAVEIPVNGITETATITIEQIEKATECNATTGTQYIFAVHATSVDTGHSLTDDQINQVAITLPFDLKTIHPGDIENGSFNVYRAKTLEQLEKHETDLITSIRQSDYIGNGKIGSVTVLVDELSYFAIGIPKSVVPVNHYVKDEGGGDCFIGILH